MSDRPFFNATVLVRSAESFSSQDLFAPMVGCTNLSKRRG